jgi:hypothetical protein
MKHASFASSVVLSSIAIATIAAIGCGPSQPANTTTNGAPEPAIAETWRAKCGNCHTRVEPGTRTRAQLDDALPRHRSRARLSDAEWVQLEDFLAAK